VACIGKHTASIARFCLFYFTSPSFDIMGYRLYKTYVDLSNIIIRISNGTDAGKQHALLVNAHVDSTPPSPGAADDAMPVGVMLECLRVLLYTKDWEPSHAIIFCEYPAFFF
jgi:Zn-dependent M28 family amino/carboxypeptidase